MDALKVNAIDALEYYSVFGGVPRYWELAAEHQNLERAIKDLILDRKGVLHEEPMRLLLDDLKSAAQPYSILSLMGMGCEKISEIASRLEKPATSLTRPLATLQDLEYVKKEVPFGENPKKSKKTFYKISDPFVRFFFRFVMPNKSKLELELVDHVWSDMSPKLVLHQSEIWEELARWSVPFLNIGGGDWGIATRWWGKGMDGKTMEIDVMAESLDGARLLIGEVKWSGSINVNEILNKLKYSASNIKGLGSKEITYAIWAKNGAAKKSVVITPDMVFSVLR